MKLTSVKKLSSPRPRRKRVFKPVEVFSCLRVSKPRIRKTTVIVKTIIQLCEILSADQFR